MPVVKLRNAIQQEVYNVSSMSSPTTVVANTIYDNSNILQWNREDKEVQTTTSDLSKQTGYNILNNNTLFVTIQNVTSSFSLKTHLNLRYIALNGHNVEFKRGSGV